MADLAHYWGNDLSISANGDLLTTLSATVEGQQRVLRRLLTNAFVTQPDGSQTLADYIFHPTYGAGVPRQVGQTLNIPAVKAAIRAQIFQEAAVARSPEPSITVVPITNGVNCIIKYVDSVTRQNVTLNFDASQ